MALTKDNREIANRILGKLDAKIKEGKLSTDDLATANRIRGKLQAKMEIKSVTPSADVEPTKRPEPIKTPFVGPRKPSKLADIAKRATSAVFESVNRLAPIQDPSGRTFIQSTAKVLEEKARSAVQFARREIPPLVEAVGGAIKAVPELARKALPGALSQAGKALPSPLSPLPIKAEGAGRLAESIEAITPEVAEQVRTSFVGKKVGQGVDAFLAEGRVGKFLQNKIDRIPIPFEDVTDPTAYQELQKGFVKGGKFVLTLLKPENKVQLTLDIATLGASKLTALVKVTKGATRARILEQLQLLTSGARRGKNQARFLRNQMVDRLEDAKKFRGGLNELSEAHKAAILRGDKGAIANNINVRRSIDDKAALLDREIESLERGVTATRSESDKLFEADAVEAEKILRTFTDKAPGERMQEQLLRQKSSGVITPGKIVFDAPESELAKRTILEEMSKLDATSEIESARRARRISLSGEQPPAKSIGDKAIEGQSMPKSAALSIQPGEINGPQLGLALQSGEEFSKASTDALKLMGDDVELAIKTSPVEKKATPIYIPPSVRGKLREPAGSTQLPIGLQPRGKSEMTSTWDKAFTQARKVLRKMGPKGEELATRQQGVIDMADKFGGIIETRMIRATQNFSKIEKDLVSKILDPGRALDEADRALPYFDKADKAANRIKRLFGIMRNSLYAASEGTIELKSLNNVFPHIYDLQNDSVIDAVRKKIMDSHIASNPTDTIEDARSVADITINKYKKEVGSRASRVYDDSAEMSILYGVDSYQKDLDTVLKESVRSHSIRIAENKWFGLGDELAMANIADLETLGKDHEFARRIMERQVTGLPATGLTKSFKKIKALNVVTKMGFSAIRNLQQTFINTLPRTNMLSTAKALREVQFNLGNKKFNELLDNTVLQSLRETIASAAGFDPAKVSGTRLFGLQLNPEQFLEFVGFMRAERFNRKVAAHAGIFYAKENAEVLVKTGGKGRAGEFAIRKLKELGVSDERLLVLIKRGGAGFKQSELIDIGKLISEQTQFTTNVLDLPLFWTEDAGRFVTQFKTFSFKQAVFFRDHIVNEARQGNVKPAAWFIVMSEFGGVTTQTAIDFLSGKPVEDTAIVRQLGGQSIVQSFMENLMFSGATGAFVDIGAEIAPKMFGGKSFPGRAASFLGGPSLSVAGSIFELPGDIASNPNRAFQRALRLLPGAKPLPLATPIIARNISEILKSGQAPGAITAPLAIIQSARESAGRKIFQSKE